MTGGTGRREEDRALEVIKVAADKETLGTGELTCSPTIWIRKRVTSMRGIVGTWGKLSTANSLGSLKTTKERSEHASLETAHVIEMVVGEYDDAEEQVDRRGRCTLDIVDP